MKKAISIMGLIFGCAFSVQAARWDGATVDMGNSVPHTLHLSDIDCNAFFPVGSVFYNLQQVKCNKPQTDPYKDDSYLQDDFNTDYYRQDDYTQDDLFDDYLQDYNDDKFARQQYNRELRNWSEQVAQIAYDELKARWAYGESLPYLSDNAMNDMIANGYYIDSALMSCFSNHIYRDSFNISNQIESKRDVAAFLAGDLRDCYIRLRVNPSWRAW